MDTWVLLQGPPQPLLSWHNGKICRWRFGWRWFQHGITWRVSFFGALMFAVLQGPKFRRYRLLASVLWVVRSGGGAAWLLFVADTFFGSVFVIFQFSSKGLQRRGCLGC